MAKRKSRKTKSPVRARGKAASLHIGVNAVDPRHYDGWGGELAACEFDAKAMGGIGRARGMKSCFLAPKPFTV